jgi:hypothetical protein
MLLVQRDTLDYAGVILSVLVIGLAVVQIYLLRGTLKATTAAANAAQLSAGVARDTLHITQRAYLHISAVQFATFGVGQRPTLIIQVSNGGHLPASVTEWGNVLYTDEGLPDPYTGETLQWLPQTGIVAPGHKVTMSAQVQSDPFTEAEWARIQTGDYQLAIFGALRYHAGFDMAGETGYGLTFDPTATMLPFHRRFINSLVTGYNYAK